MSDERQHRAREIALAAQKLEPEERVSFLADACRENERLRKDVEDLLVEIQTPSTREPRVVPGVESTIRSHFDRTDTHFSGTDLGDEVSRGQQEFVARKSVGAARYVFKGEVGRGGMGAVLKVYDTDLRRNLAMKVILGKDEKRGKGTPSVPPAVIDRFLEEAQVTGQLEHPGVVPVHELGVDGDGQMYFTMRLVRGKSFDEIIRLARADEEGWSRSRALHALLKVCETLAYAHSRRVIHRDLKPANIMIGRFGETYVMDWGAARILDRIDPEAPANPSGTFSMVRSDRKDQVAGGQTPSATQEGMVIGTPFYMPREQAAGHLDEIGPHSDVYAVGCMLYQLMAGRRPYELPDRQRSVMEVVSLVITGPPEPVDKLAPTAPIELVAICQKAMAHDWRDRYPNMMQMADDLRAYIDGKVVRAHQTGVIARFQKWVGRNRALAASLGAAIALALGILVVVVVLQGNMLSAVEAEKRQTAAALDLALKNELEAGRNAEIARRESYVANLVAANASLRANEVLEGKRLLEAAGEELRGWEWRHLLLRSDSSERQLHGHTQRVLGVVFHHDGRRVASSAVDGTVRIWDAVDGRELLVLPELEGNAVGLAFSRDGHLLWTYGGFGDATVRGWDATTGEAKSAMALPAEPVSSVVVDEARTRLAFASTGNVVHIVDAESCQPLVTIEEHEGEVHALAFVQGKGQLLTASGDGSVRLWDAQDGSLIRTFGSPSEDGGVFSIAVHPSADELVSGAENGVVRRWQMSDGASAVVTRHAAVVYGLAYSWDGGQLASASADKTVRVVDLESSKLIVQQGHDETVRCVAFDPKGRLLVSGSDDTSLRVWNTRVQAVAVQAGPEEHVRAVAVAPNGKRFVLAAHFGGSIVSYDENLVREAVHPGEGDPVNELAFSTDGKLLAAAYEEAACVRIYTVPSLAAVRTLEGHDASVSSIAFRPDSLFLASGSTDYTVKLWSVETGEELHEYPGRDEEVQKVAFSPDGALLAAAYVDGTVLVWDVESEELLKTHPGHPQGAFALAWSPDGAQLAVGSGKGELWLWDETGSGPPTVRTGHDERISSITYSPDGSRIVSGSWDGSLRVWDATTQEALVSLRDHTDAVSSVVFSSDGTTLVSGSWDNTMRLWRTR